MNKEIIILSGIPCSGKSTWRNEKMKQPFTRCILYANSRMFNYVHNPNVRTIILDNTHCKEGYLDKIITDYSKNNTIKVMFFDVSLLKAHYRNIIRVLSTGKWIPFKVINIMYKNFNKIKREKYGKYSGELFF